MRSKFFNENFLALFGLILVGCGQGDRGGISLGNKPSSDNVSSNSSSASSVKSSVSIISAVGKCLNMDPSDYLSRKNETLINAWACSPKASNQQWIWQDSGRIESTNGLCLAAGDPGVDSIPVVAMACETSDDQWVYDEYTAEIKNVKYSGYCLDLFSDYSLLDGQAINLWQCNNNLNQRWAASELKVVRIRSHINENLFINIEPNGVENNLHVSTILNGWLSALWVIEPSENAFRIRNFWEINQFLHIQNGVLESGLIEWGWSSARWFVVPRPDIDDRAFMLRSVWKPNLYIGLDSGNSLIIEEFSNLVDGSFVWLSSED